MLCHKSATKRFFLGLTTGPNYRDNHGNIYSLFCHKTSYKNTLETSIFISFIGVSTPQMVKISPASLTPLALATSKKTQRDIEDFPHLFLLRMIKDIQFSLRMMPKYDQSCDFIG